MRQSTKNCLQYIVFPTPAGPQRSSRLSGIFSVSLVIKSDCPGICICHIWIDYIIVFCSTLFYSILLNNSSFLQLLNLQLCYLFCEQTDDADTQEQLEIPFY